MQSRLKDYNFTLSNPLDPPHLYVHFDPCIPLLTPYVDAKEVSAEAPHYCTYHTMNVCREWLRRNDTCSNYYLQLTTGSIKVDDAAYRLLDDRWCNSQENTGVSASLAWLPDLPGRSRMIYLRELLTNRVSCNCTLSARGHVRSSRLPDQALH